MVLIIGLTGQAGVGKDYLKNFLGQATNYPVFSLSDVLRADLRGEGVEPTRELLIERGNKLRREHGAGCVARRVIEMISGSAIVDSFKNPGEVEEFRKVFGKSFVLISVQAPREVQFKRIKDRSREGDPTTLEGFNKLLTSQNTRDELGLRVSDCDKLADFTLLNEGSVEELGFKAGALLSFIQQNF